MKNLIPLAIGAFVLMQYIKKKKANADAPPRDSDITLPDEPVNPPRGTPSTNIITGRIRRR